MLRLSLVAVLALALGAQAHVVREAKAASGLDIECGSTKTNLLEHADFVKGGPDTGIWRDFCKDFDPSKAKKAVVTNPHGDVTLSYTPKSGGGGGVKECGNMFLSLAVGCAGKCVAQL